MVTPLVGLLNREANRLALQKRELLGEIHRLEEPLRTLESGFNREVFVANLRQFSDLMDEACPEEIRLLLCQVLLRLFVREGIWSPDGHHHLRYIAVVQLPAYVRKPPKKPKPRSSYEDGV